MEVARRGLKTPYGSSEGHTGARWEASGATWDPRGFIIGARGIPPNEHIEKGETQKRKTSTN